MIEQLAYSIDEAAAASGLSRRTIYNRIQSGELPARKNGQRTVILVSDLKEWLNSLPKFPTSSDKTK